MVKAKFNGDAENQNYQCTEFFAKKGNTVSMPNERWAAITKEGKEDLFTLISEDTVTFPTPTTVGPK